MASSARGGPAPPGIRPAGAERFRTRLDAALAASRHRIPALCRRLSAWGHPISPATLRSWRTGRRQPERLTSLDALGVLEELLDLPNGALTEALAPPRRRGPRSPHTPLWQLVEPSVAAARLMHELGLPVDDGLETLSEDHVVEVGVHRLEHRLSQRAVRRAARDGVDRFAFLLTAANPLPEPPRMAATFGMRTVGCAHDLGAGTFCWALQLDRPLARGEAVVTEHLIELPRDRVSSNSYRAYLDRRVALLSLVLRCDAATPAGVTGWWKGPSGPPSDAPVTVSGGSTSLVRRGVGPGEVGLRWSW